MTLPIVTERLVLRRYTHDDIPDLLGFASQPSVASVTSRGIPATEKGVRGYIDLQNSYQPFEKDKVFELAVERKEDGRVMGLLGLIRGDHRQGEIGWALGAEYRGQGYATEAARALVDYGFSRLDLHRIHADTNSDNRASWKLMERLGMRREALLRGAVYEGGKWVDRVIYGLLVDEWREPGASGRWNDIRLQPIGFVSSPVTERTDENWGEIRSTVVLNPEFAGALLGLEDFSHAIVVTYLHQARFEKGKHLQRRPRNLETMPKVGILSQRAKNRPNPIGVTAVEIVTAGHDYLEVEGLDAIDGTPVLDVKPYYPHYDRIDTPKVPEWVDRLMEGYF